MTNIFTHNIGGQGGCTLTRLAFQPVFTLTIFYGIFPNLLTSRSLQARCPIFVPFKFTQIDITDPTTFPEAISKQLAHRGGMNCLQRIDHYRRRSQKFTAHRILFTSCCMIRRYASREARVELPNEAKLSPDEVSNIWRRVAFAQVFPREECLPIDP